MSKTATASPKNGLRGLSVERRYSTPGVHPFDQIEWEIRDAVIGNPESPAFEQRGVEFPKTWSQNATNIVAQKYFRGRVGNPERESSVRERSPTGVARAATSPPRMTPRRSRWS
jgi:ribonucleoside-diphosphate reductase alpha chain